MRYLPLWEWEEESRDEREREGKEEGRERGKGRREEEREGGKEGGRRRDKMFHCVQFTCVVVKWVNSYRANIVITLTSCVETEIEDDLLQTPVISLVDRHNIVT